VSQKKSPKPPKRPRSKAEESQANAIKGKRPPHPGESEIIAERRMRALNLRKAGGSYRQIAQQLGVSLNTAWADVNAELLELREQTKADAAEVRDLELQRCDEMILGLWPAVRRGDPKAVSAAVRVSERRSKLLGLDAPSKSEISGANGGPVELLEVRESLARKLAGLAARLGSSGVAGEPDGR
jgi:hypothetical protein